MSRQRQGQDSLELFLDTICNMFGGFVFIMLFVVVSLRMTTDKAMDETVKEEQASAIELAELQIELESLQGQWSSVSDRVEEARALLERLGTKETADVRRETLDVLDDLADVSESNAEKANEVAEIERRAMELDAASKVAETELADAKRTLQNAQDDVEAARKNAARNTSPPQMSAHYFDREIGVILKYGRLYLWHKYTGRASVLNSDDFHVVEEDGTTARVEPLPWRGVDLNAPGVTQRLDAVFDEFSPKTDKIALVVASDSYEEYSIVVDYLKNRLFRIRPIVGQHGSKVFDRGGSESRSQ